MQGWEMKYLGTWARAISRPDEIEHVRLRLAEAVVIIQHANESRR